MAFVATDLDGREHIYPKEPKRERGTWYASGYIELPSGTIKKLIGRDLDWNDEPVELK